MTRRYWRAKYNIFDFRGLYHEPPPPLAEDVLAIGKVGKQHLFRLLSDEQGEQRRPLADLPFAPGGQFLMNIRAAKALLPLISPWVNIQPDVLVDGQQSHILAIVTQQYDAMNEAASIGKRGVRSGIWLEVEELHLIDAKIGPASIFRVPTTGLQWDHILSEEIADAMRAYELTGLTLQEAVVE